VAAEYRRPTTVEAIVAAVKRESSDQLRLAVLIMLMVLIGALGLSVGFLIGVRDIDAAAVEAAGTWFGALVSFGAVVIAARVFLSDKLFQDYQLAADREREATDRERQREERADKDRYLVAQARLVDLGLEFTAQSVVAGARPDFTEITAVVVNNSHDRINKVRAAHPEFGSSNRPLREGIDPGNRADFYLTRYGKPADIEGRDLRKFILAAVTLTFTQNDHKWIKQGEQDPERVEQTDDNRTDRGGLPRRKS
jgi:hypothetical protein